MTRNTISGATWLIVAIVSVLSIGMLAEPSEASCVVEGESTYTSGTVLRNERCDTSGSQKTVVEGLSFIAVTADQLVKSGAGVLHTLTCQSDAAATAGTIVLYDNTAESGTEIFRWVVSASLFAPHTLTFDARFATGLFIGYTTTADVNCTITYR